MIAVVSPAKNLDFKSEIHFKGTQPRLLECTNQLVDVMRTKSVDDVADLMSISRQLAGLNVHRYKTYESTHTDENARPAALAFNGDVYQGLQAPTFDEARMEFASRHFRILSGLYGLLRPLDLIQPYRLEMGTKLAFDDYKTLYQYWDNTILDLLLKDLKEQGDDIILNLASNEYFKSVNKKQLDADIITPVFKDLKNGNYKIISFFAKKARGLMSAYIIKNKLQQPARLKKFDWEGYTYNEAMSSDREWVFTRNKG